MKSIVVGLDGSLPARQALEWARTLGGGEAELHLVYACEPGPFIPDAAELYAEALDRATEAGARLLGEAEAALQGCRVHCHLREAPPARALLETARQTGAGLIVLGRTGAGSGNTGGPEAGSVCRAVVRRSPAPVLVADGPRPAALERVLVAGEEAGERALLFARQWVPGAEVTALRVVPDKAGGEPHFSREVVAVNDHLMAVQRWGQPTDGVAEECRTGLYDLAVVGRRSGRPWLDALRAWLTGSAGNSERLLRLTPGFTVLLTGN